jgi:hypothetical protein
MSPLPHSFTSSTYRLSNQISIINGSNVIEAGVMNPLAESMSMFAY